MINIKTGSALEVLRTLPDESIQCCVTSPPYWGLRDYCVEDQLGLEKTPEKYVATIVSVFEEVKRTLKKDGTLWLNLGDSYYGSGGSYGNRPELDGTTSSQREKNSKYFNRPGSQTHRSKPVATQKHPSLKPKDLIGIPWKVAFALQAEGWYLRSDIIWNKPNPMPESVQDRPTKSHEYIFLLTKSAKYYYNSEAIKEPGTGQTGLAATFKRTSKESLVPNQSTLQHRTNQPDTSYASIRNKRSVWTIPTKTFSGAHFATYPPELITPCIRAGSKPGDIILDPFSGSGTTGEVAITNNRNYIGIELNPEYVQIQRKRLAKLTLDYSEITPTIPNTDDTEDLFPSLNKKELK